MEEEKILLDCTSCGLKEHCIPYQTVKNCNNIHHVNRRMK